MSQPPKKKTKQPLKEGNIIRTKNHLVIFAVKSNESSKKKPKSKFNFPKHRKIDRSAGTDYNITYGGVTVKITEFKIKTNKPWVSTR